MAEHLENNNKLQPIKSGPNEGFNAMGKPVPVRRRLEADRHLKEMGITKPEDRFTCIQMMSKQLEHDNPYGAQNDAMKYVDLVGAYRLMSVLLTGPEE